MDYKWIKKNGSDRLIIFFNGWGMDETPFLRLTSDATDVIMLFGYHSLELAIDLQEIVKSYQKTDLIAWSMGVWVASQVNLPELSSKTAINGTLKPIDNDFGIPKVIYQKTLDAMDDEKTVKRFMQRMFSNISEYKVFAKNSPERNVPDQKAELASLQSQISASPTPDFEYDQVVIGSLDKIIPGKNQIAFWGSHPNVTILEEGHFLFYLWNSWDELVK